MNCRLVVAEDVVACWAELVRGRASDASRDWPRVRRTSEVNHEWNNNLSSSLSPPPLFAVASRASGEFSLKKRLAQSKPRVSQKFVFRLTLRIAFPLIPNLHNSADEQNAICLSALSLLKTRSRTQLDQSQQELPLLPSRSYRSFRASSGWEGFPDTRDSHMPPIPPACIKLQAESIVVPANGSLIVSLGVSEYQVPKTIK